MVWNVLFQTCRRRCIREDASAGSQRLQGACSNVKHQARMARRIACHGVHEYDASADDRQRSIQERQVSNTVDKGIGNPMKGIGVSTMPKEEIIQNRGW
jgi:hypothetical protein